MCVNFGDRRSRDRELRHKKRKKRQFLGRKFIHPLVTQKPFDVPSRNLETTWVPTKA